MKKIDIYELRDILHKMMYIKQADTDKTATQEEFCEAYKKGMAICNKEINKRGPL